MTSVRMTKDCRHASRGKNNPTLAHLPPRLSFLAPKGVLNHCICTFFLYYSNLPILHSSALKFFVHKFRTYTTPKSSQCQQGCYHLKILIYISTWDPQISARGESASPSTYLSPRATIEPSNIHSAAALSQTAWATRAQARWKTTS